ncbi:tetratricopeptide repeat protein [Robertkochia marina]|uniref:Tetratricopeptide repeat protein n=1 Tax=Robertkochia marina TaxID=1227945 RepID=A0A4S3M3N3_9FLAO|nr:tetratricopeptide repeat protein [Robertkochia marina]THD69365.1 tetratricopeptide repeat protein [Robertkochia marina]TRZ47375.1 hypothetical protein D3A96_01290 [Robertkochia marina]
MKVVYSIRPLILAAIFCFTGVLCAQVEENADITTEVVEDTFQENFFEALKQKGIGNYDKALHYLTQCKSLNAGEPAVDFEMGRIYLLNRDYMAAEDHLLRAVKAAPSNVWYLNETVHLYLEQNALDKAVAITEEYQDQGWEQQLIMAGLYLKKGDEDKALAIVERVNNNHGPLAEAAAHRMKLSIMEKTEPEEEVQQEAETSATRGEGEEGNTPDHFRRELKTLADQKRYDRVLLKSTDAVSNFPAQPEFYYYRALGLLHTGDPEQAVAVAEEGLAYLLENKELELRFFQIMKEAYTELGNEDKIKEIDSKIEQLHN